MDTAHQHTCVCYTLEEYGEIPPLVLNGASKSINDFRYGRFTDNLPVVAVDFVIAIQIFVFDIADCIRRECLRPTIGNVLLII